MQTSTHVMIGKRCKVDEAMCCACRTSRAKRYRVANKPMKRARRPAKRHKRRKASSFKATEEGQAYFKAKGKSLAKSLNNDFRFGQNRANPRGPDGEVMECISCGSTDHFQAKCPQQKQQQGGSNSTNTTNSFRSWPPWWLEL